MIRKNNVSTFKISEELSEVVLKKIKVNTCNADFIFLFSGQKPISAILLIEGIVEIESGKNVLQIQGRNMLFLHDEFLNSKNVKSSFKVLANSVYCWADQVLIEAIISSNKVLSASTS